MGNATFVQDGASIDYTPSADVAAGDIVNLGAIIGIAKRPITAAVLGALAIEGIFSLLKDGTTGPVFSQGDHVFWDSVNELAVRTGGSGCWYLGTAIAAAGTNEALVRVELAPHGLPAALVDKVWEDVDISGGSKVLDAEDVGKVLNITVGHATNVITLPATAAGLAFVVRCGASGERVAVSPQAADKIMGADLAGTDNKDHILDAATSLLGDYVSLEYGGADGYMIRAERGIWTNEA